ncbi:MAG TPA: hypothetical protein VFS43_33320 [Polyangiaceae bacterium]|nr:hypothetical protein [Polyangiaceae bacterium]
MRASTLVWVGALTAACSSGYQVNPDGYCRRRPADPACAAGAGGSAGASGGGGAGGASGTGGASGLGGGGGGMGGSGGLACAAPTVECGGACVDLKADDAQNCGACGRSCRGATCTQGACVPEAMASNEVAPYALADDGSYLYWVSPAIKDNVAFSRMRRVAKASAGGAAENAFAGTIVRARSLAFADGKLFWGDLGASPSDVANQRLVSAAPADLGPQLVAGAQPGIEHVALAAGKAYWLIGGGGGAVRGKSADGTGDISPEVFGQVNPSWLSVDGDAQPYWVAVDAAGTGREVRRAVSSNAAEPVASGGAGLRAVELFGDRFYWADGAAVRSRPKASPTEAPREELTAAGPVEGFAVVAAGGGGAGGAGGAAGAGGGEGEATLYVLTAEGRQLRAWRKGPDDAEPLLLGEVEAKAAAYAGNPFGAAYVRVDAQYVYFADVGTLTGATPELVQVSAGDGVVYRVAR